MPQLEQLVRALRNADAAGDVQAAQTLAAAIRREQQTEAQREARRERLRLENPAEYDPDSPEFKARYGATAGMSGTERFLAGAGKSVVDLGRGVRQIGAEIGNRLGIVSDETVADLRARQDDVEALDASLMDTGAGLAGNITGTVATALLPATGAARVAQAANFGRTATAARAIANPTTYRAAAAVGAAQGALQPVGTQGSRTLNTALGAGAGTAARGAIGLIGGGTRAAKRAFEGENAKAARFIQEALERDGMTPQEAVARLTELGPNARLVDLGEHVAGLARATSNSGAARRTARDFLEERHAGQRNRFIELTGLGDVGEFVAATRKFMNARHSNAQALYQEAYDAPLDLTTPKLQELLNRPTMRAVMRSAERVIADEGGAVGHVRVMDAAARQLADKAGAALRAGAKDKARRFSKMRSELLAEVDAQVPQYAQARSIYSGEAALRDAVVLGRNLLTKPRLDLDAAQSAIEAMGEGELEAFQRGVLRGFVDKLETASAGKDVASDLIDSPRAREILRLAFRDEGALERLIRAADTESRFARTRSAVLGARPTSALDQSDGLQDGAGIVSALVRNDALQATGILLQKLGVGKVSDETRAAISRALFGRDVPWANGPGRVVELGRRLERAARPAVVHGASAAAAVNQ